MVFSFLFKFQNMYNILQANSGEPDQTPRSAASDLHCLPMPYKKDARLIWVNKRIQNSWISPFDVALPSNTSF